MDKKVSVIIPVYNVEKYLRQCLDSVINQTLEDIEIICVDDGSTDNSFTILNNYASKDSRIKVIHQENQGQGVARNIGIEKATGKYLSILDSDDIFELNMLDLMYNQAEKTNADITICKAQSLNVQTNKITKRVWLRYLPNKEVFSYKDLLPYHVFDFCIGWSWDKLYKREFVEKYKFRFYEHVKHSEDLFFVFHSVVCAKRMTTVQNVLITHRQNTGTQISELRDNDCLCFIPILKDFKKILEDLNLYKELEQSFINWSVDFCYWHLDTITQKENKLKLLEELKSKFFKELNIYNLDKKYFYNSGIYMRLHNLKHYNNKWYQNIFSVKNQVHGITKYKVITILGISFFVKRGKKV